MDISKATASGQRPMLSLGAIFRYSYFDPQANPLGTFDVTSADFE